ncbi:MAG: hypothetical protein WCN98_18975 [Verrucomicrobiaceae bacterium]
MDSADSLLWGFIFGAIGMGYFVYGKHQRNLIMLSLGMLLCVFPYFVSSLIWMLLIGAALTFAPLFLNRHQ